MVDFSDLDSLDGGSVKKNADRPTFPCQSCGGSGQYTGTRVHQPKSECFSCGGRGFFYSSHADRMKKKAQTDARKRSKLETSQEVFNSENPGLVDWMRANLWSDFIRQMLTAYSEHGGLTEGQLRAILSTRAKQAAKRAEKQAEIENKSATVDLSPIHAMFDKARANGLSKLAYRADGLILKPAKSTSKNAGAIYVTDEDGEYLGKVMGVKFIATNASRPEDAATLLRIAENPAEVAKAYGIRTGICSCCGRELTDPSSIAAGIGPVCATKWEF